MDYAPFMGEPNRPDDIERQLDSRTREAYTVTAIVSAYASTRFLPGLLDDLLGQTLYARGELEIVIVDSHSPEDDWALIEAAARQHEHIRAIRTVERETLYAAWNRAIAEARGRYISNANTDDRHRRDNYELLAGVLDARPDVALVYANSYVSRTENEPFEANDGSEPFTTPAFFAPNQLLHFPFGAQPMWRASVHERIGVFDGSFKAAGDWDFAIRLCHEFRALHVEEVLGSYLVQENTISFRDDTVTRENALIHERIHNPETAWVLYRREDLALDTPCEKARALVDLGVRALGYRIPYGTPKNKLPLAARFFNEATRLASDWPAGWNNLGVALAMSGRADQAVDVLTALAGKTDHPAVARNLAASNSLLAGEQPADGFEALPSELDFPDQTALQESRVGPERSVRAMEVVAGQNGDARSVEETKPRSEAAASAIEMAVQRLQRGDLPGGMEMLDEALARDPIDIRALDVFRSLYVQVESDVQRRRDAELAARIRSATGADRLAWIQRSGQFHEAPESMTAIWEVVQDGLRPQPPDSSPPLATVVLTVHNHEAYVEDAFRSVLAQTERRWELVIVDDNSSDNTPAVLDRLIAEHPDHRITRLRLPGVGPARARNTGAARGHAPTLLLLDGDDVLAADVLEHSLAALDSDPKVGWAYPISVQKGSFHRLWSNRPFDVAELASADRMPVNSLMRREMFEALGGFSPDLEGAYEDWDLWLRAVRTGWKAVLVPAALFLYRKLPGSRCDFNGRPEEREVTAKRTMMRRVPEAYLPDAVDHPALEQVLRIPPQLVNRAWTDRMEQRFADQLPPDPPEAAPGLAVAEPVEEARTATAEVVAAAHPDARSATPARPVRVLAYVFKNVHIPILLPIVEEMRRRGGYEIALAVHPYDRAIRAGVEPAEMETLRSLGLPVLSDPREWNSDVALMADNVAGLLAGCGRIVNVGHGLLSKGQYFTDSEMIHRENLEDLLCVPGPYHQQRLAESGKVFVPVAATGFAKLGALFDPSGPTRDDLMRRHGLDPEKRTVLFAPTFNVELSAIPILWMRVAELADESTYLLIKLHGSTLPEFKQAYRELADRHENVVYLDEPDITPALRMADVMVSDVSSAFMEFMALDKPVVLFDNPNVASYKHYDPRDIEYAWRDLGPRASTMEDVKDSVRRSFELPEEYAERRRSYADQLLAGRDGRAAANVVDAIDRLLDGSLGPAQTLTARTAVLLPVAAGEEGLAAASARSVLEQGGDHAELLLVDHGCNMAALRSTLGARAGAVDIVTPEELDDRRVEVAHFALMRPGVRVDERRLFRLTNHLRREDSLVLVAPLLADGPGGTGEQSAARYVQLEPGLLNDPIALDRRLRVGAVAQLLPHKVHAEPRLLAAKVGSDAASALLQRARHRSHEPLPGARLAADVVIGPAGSAAQPAAASPAGSSGTVSDRMRLVAHYERKGDLARALEHARRSMRENATDSGARAAVARLEKAMQGGGADEQASRRSLDPARDSAEEVATEFDDNSSTGNPGDEAVTTSTVSVSSPHSRRTVIVSMSDSGGAGTAAWRLHRGLLDSGRDSLMIVGMKKRDDPTVKVLPLDSRPGGGDLLLRETGPDNDVWKAAAARWAQNMAEYPNRPAGLETFTDGRSAIRLDRVREIREAGLVNLHWVAGLLDLPTAAPALAGKPVVWTLHDLNPFTGGCHYSAGCHKYRETCGACPALGSGREDDLSRTTWRQRADLYRELDLHVVTPSAWLAEEARSSGLFGGRDVRHIRNAHPLDVFKPRDTRALRRRLGIADGERVILFGADAVSNMRKGFMLLEQALPALAALLDPTERVVLLTMGRKPAPLTPPANFRVLHLGSLNDEHRIAAVYSLADLFVIPSLEDNLPNTIAEAMACGTPAAGFAIGGIPEMIEHQRTGYLAKPFETEDLARGMAWTLAEMKRNPAIRELCRENAERDYDQAVQAGRYAALFDELMAVVDKT